MERYNNIVKIEKIKKCLEQGEVSTALMVAETINKKKLKNLSDLSVLAEAYFQNKHYESAKEIFLMIYSKNKARRILAQLVHLSIKLNNAHDSQMYLEEFIRIAPRDFYRHIFRYNIDKMLGKDLKVLIADLEELKQDEYMESWAYELAKLYHKAGEEEKCIKECSNIVLWFGSGVYVDKAKALRAYYLGELDLTEIAHKDNQLNEDQVALQINRILEETELKEKKALKLETNNSKNIVLGNIQYILKSPVIVSMVIHKSTYNKIAVTDEEVLFDNEFLLTTKELEAMKKNLFKQAKLLEKELNQSSDQIFELDDSKQTVVDRELASFDENMSENKITLDKETKLADKEEIINETNRSSNNEMLSETESEDHTYNQEVDSLIGVNKKEVYSTSGKDQDLIIEEQRTDVAIVKYNMKDYDLNLEKQGKLYHLLEKENVLFHENLPYFIHVDVVKKQLIECYEAIIEHNFVDVNFVITGDMKTGKTSLAKCITKFLRKMNSHIASKIALIDARKLNNINFEMKKAQLIGCTVIIENAGELSEKSIEGLIELNACRINYASIILEGDVESINRLFFKYKELEDLFHHRIFLPEYTVEDYLGFAYDYLKEREYEIDTEAFSAIRDYILTYLQEKREYTLQYVFSFMHDIVQRAETRCAKQLLEIVQKGESVDTDLLIIRIQDVIL